MSGTGEVAAELKAIRRLIARAEAELRAERLVDLASLQGRVEALCGRIERLPAPDGRAVQPQLLALVDDFDRLARSIETKMNGLKEEMGEASRRRRAVSAYSKNAGRGK